ncbi:hypothetical protein DVH21_16555 [Micromonospora aurantiaca]|uniref:Uncharacterized protein n=1 Tax=Micromonospora aurantiaca (nom. illeg.) TaxID=47850 RepID=A0A6N3K0F8_9ACTN|nr:hypothetical protein DVH21_16555 [Micromonospora aurantiaca]
MASEVTQPYDEELARQQTADSRQQTADSRQQTADSRQQTADSRQSQTRDENTRRRALPPTSDLQETRTALTASPGPCSQSAPNLRGDSGEARYR